MKTRSENPQKGGAGGSERSLAGVLGVLYHPLNLGVLLTLFQPEGADYAHHITASNPGIWEFCQPYSNQRGQIMPTTLLLEPPESLVSKYFSELSLDFRIRGCYQ